MKNIFFILLLFTITVVNAQEKVALQNNGTTTIFNGATAFIDAFNTASTGDTIYLPGGAFSVPTSFNKGVVIIGAGFHPDSTTATLPTVLNGDINLDTGADSISFEGLLISNKLQKTFSVSVDNMSIIRCRINEETNFSRNGSASAVSNQLVIFQSVLIGDLNLDGMQNVLISNSFIENRVESSESNTFKNNSFLKYTGASSNHLFILSNNNTFLNNIFSTSNNTIISGNGNIFQKNVFNSTSPNLGGSSVDINNYKGINLSTVYTNQTGNAFDYAHDYHLLPAAASTYLGNDNTEVGVYGGMFPLKEGFVPQNPHIISKTIAPTTNNNGDLNIQIKVSAEDN